VDATCWYAVRVKPRHEKSAAQQLRWSGLECFEATYTEFRRWSDRIKRVQTQLFPGYAFCRFAKEDRLTVLKTPGVVSIVSFGPDAAVVPDDEIASVRSVVASGLPVRPSKLVRVGDRVYIERGALSGVTGVLVREKSSWIVVVNITLLQRSVAVEIDRNMISSLNVTTATPCPPFSQSAPT
jgi:transcription antitermination factor NusG